MQIIHDARSEEDNQYNMIFTEKDGKYTVQYGGAEDMEPEQAESSARDMLMPLLGLEPEMYQDFAASVSAMMVRSYGIAIVKPAEGKTQDVVDALQAFVDGQRQTMENYLMDQYEYRQGCSGQDLVHRRGRSGVLRKQRPGAGQHRKGSGCLIFPTKQTVLSWSARKHGLFFCAKICYTFEYRQKKPGVNRI